MQKENSKAEPSTEAGNIAKCGLGDVYFSVLNSFTLKDDDFRPAMKLPWIQGDFVIASDARKIICFKKELLEGMYMIEDNPKAPDGLRVIPIGSNCDIIFYTNDLLMKIHELKFKEKSTYKREIIECNDCNGEGSVNFKYCDSNWVDHEINGECPVCDGSGKVELITDIEEDTTVESFNNVLKMNNSYFDDDVMRSLIMAANDLEEPIIKLIYKSDELAAHKFIVGECTICLMPIKFNEEVDVLVNIT